MGSDHGIGTLGGDVVDCLCEITLVVWIGFASKSGGNKTFHQEVNTESVHSLGDEGLVVTIRS